MFFDASLKSTPLPADLGTIADFAPVDAGPGSLWVLLAQDGRLFRFDAETCETDSLGSTGVPAEPDCKPKGRFTLRRRLHVSRRGDAVAVVNDFGRFGEILDLRRGVSTMTLDGGSYYCEYVPLSFALESEDGDSRRSLCHRHYFWNGGFAWLDSTRCDGRNFFSAGPGGLSRWTSPMAAAPGTCPASSLPATIAAPASWRSYPTAS